MQENRHRRSHRQTDGIKGFQVPAGEFQTCAALRDALAQLVAADGEHVRLLERAVELAEARVELGALAGDLGGFRWCVLGRRGTELLQALLGFARARLDVFDIGAECVGGGVEFAA